MARIAQMLEQLRPRFKPHSAFGAREGALGVDHLLQPVRDAIEQSIRLGLQLARPFRLMPRLFGGAA